MVNSFSFTDTLSLQPTTLLIRKISKRCAELLTEVPQARRSAERRKAFRPQLSRDMSIDIASPGHARAHQHYYT